MISFPVATALWAARFAPPFAALRRGRHRSGYDSGCSHVHSLSSKSSSNCCFKCRRAAFLIARRSAATRSFSTCRSRRVRGSVACGTCLIFGRRAPTFRSFGFAYGSMTVTKYSTLECAEMSALLKRRHVAALQKFSDVCLRQKE